LPKFAEVIDGHPRIVSRPPVIIPLRDLAASYEMTPEQARSTVEEQFRVYKATLSNDRRQMLDRFTIVDVARKVVGVGSVGTRAFMVLLQGRDSADPLFLQLKEATSSVLEDHLPKSRYNTPGRRVVEGQRLLQAASDIFLGWTRGAVQANRHYYWRQLRDMKGSAPVERKSYSRRPNPSRHRDLSQRDRTTTIRCPASRECPRNGVSGPGPPPKQYERDKPGQSPRPQLEGARVR
jgi:hypothetical protein